MTWTPGQWPRRSCRFSNATIAVRRLAPRVGCTRSPLLPPSRLPDATPTSIAPPSRARRNKLLIAAQVVVAAIVVWFVGKNVAEQVSKFREQPLVVEPRWGMIALAAGLMLAGFVVLTETWRRIIVAWGDTLSFTDAARIWF